MRKRSLCRFGLCVYGVVEGLIAEDMGLFVGDRGEERVILYR